MELNSELYTVDTLNIRIKKDKANEIEKQYLAFGWRLKFAQEDKKYFNILHLTFERDHYIKNKDELLMLQVEYESVLNEQARLKQKTNTKVASFSLILGFLALLCLVVGVVLACKHTAIGVSVFLFIVSTICILFNIYFSLWIFKKNKIKDLEKIRKLKEQIRVISNKSKKLYQEEVL